MRALIAALLLLSSAAFAGNVQEHTDGSAASTFSATTPSFWLPWRNTDLSGLLESSTTFHILNGLAGNDGTESNRQMLAPVSGTATTLYCHATSNAVDNSSIMTLRVNSADSALVATIAGDTTGDFSATGGSVSISAGDKLALELTTGSSATGTDSLTVSMCTLVVEP